MHPRSAVLAWLAGLLTGGLIASGATPALARPAPWERTASTVTIRLAPPVVTVGEPSAVVVTATPERSGRVFTLQRAEGATWQPVGTATSNTVGRAVLPLDTTVPVAQRLRVVAEADGNQPRKASATVTLRVSPTESCAPSIALVDRDATPAARCLAARLDRWKAAGLMGVGQQLNMSNQHYLDPLTRLGGRRVSVVGFDLEELALSGTYEYPFLEQGLADLAALAQQGAVLSASWHATNPHTGGAYSDRRWHDLDAILDPASPEHARFWADADEKIALLQRLQDAGAAVVLRPFHEANGGWFWWGRPSRTTYKRVWTMLQERVWTAGVHNVVWAYSFNAVTDSGVTDPVKLLPSPTRVDLAGIDAYDPEARAGTAADSLPLKGYAGVAARVRRMAMTEVGPRDSSQGTWNPATITRIARELTSKPVWALLWFDDLPPNEPLYKRQISSLRGGLSWLGSCPNGYCYLR